jgi:hypothetical protein
MGQARLKKIATAWHEAGHVVVGLSFGLPLKEATIHARHTEDGSFLGGAHWVEIASGDLSPWIYTCLAGAIVDRMRGVIGGDKDDIATLRALAWICLAHSDSFSPHATLIPRLTEIYRRQPGRVPPKVLCMADEMTARGTPVATKTLTESWAAVEQVAALLLQHTVVTPEMISVHLRS